MAVFTKAMKKIKNFTLLLNGRQNSGKWLPTSLITFSDDIGMFHVLNYTGSQPCRSEIGTSWNCELIKIIPAFPGIPVFPIVWIMGSYKTTHGNKPLRYRKVYLPLCTRDIVEYTQWMERLFLGHIARLHKYFFPFSLGLLYNTLTSLIHWNKDNIKMLFSRH